MTLLSIGEFARLSRLSAKALRRYDELGLLRPDRVDPDTGYRWYAARQLEQARLVAVLRQIGVPLARIEPMLGRPAAAVAQQVAAYWAEAESAHAARRDLAGYLVDRLNGKEAIMYEVASRDVPERRLLCLKRNVDEAGAWTLGQEFVGLLQSRPLPRVPGEAGGAFTIYYGEVTQDSDGPVEWCRPVPADQAEALAAQYPELTLRAEPAHQEAYVHLGDPQATPPRWQLIAETMQAWAVGQGLQERDRAADLPPRVTFRRHPPGRQPVAADCDYAVPFHRP
ncbi:MAG TPA: helix-turn-helix domain-containing protein [Streptosporangiaceae bacterium]|jgi:DNA-binding transcriptional MerR regulator